MHIRIVYRVWNDFDRAQWRPLDTVLFINISLLYFTVWHKNNPLEEIGRISGPQQSKGSKVR